MKQAIVYNNDLIVGMISKSDEGVYRFEYDDAYYLNPSCPAISLTLPKSQKVYVSDELFPFFFNLLSEGSNKKLQSLYLKIDENDYFELLLKTAQTETIGAIYVKEVSDDTAR